MAGEAALQGGDRVPMFIDGVIEGRGSSGQPLGGERLIDVVSKASLAGADPPETLRAGRS